MAEKKLKKIGKFNLISEDKCELEGCECGWNIHNGGEDKKDLKKLKEYLKKFQRIANILKEKNG